MVLIVLFYFWFANGNGSTDIITWFFRVNAIKVSLLPYFSFNVINWYFLGQARSMAIEAYSYGRQQVSFVINLLSCRTCPRGDDRAPLVRARAAITTPSIYITSDKYTLRRRAGTDLGEDRDVTNHSTYVKRFVVNFVIMSISKYFM